MKYIKLLIYLFVVLTSISKTQAQDFSVKGKVTDPNGLALPGVNIVSNTNEKKTSTDFDGSYSIKTNSKSTLTFSFIGYDNQVMTVNGRNTIDVRLKENYSGLNEVVVVGYGTQKKSVTTGAISSVKAKDLQDLPITRIEQALQGRTSGVFIAANNGEPGANSTIRIRGISSFNSNDPLWVVDGVVVDANGIGYLNQSDIESVEVLKDAASQAIYGTRAANGVIIVTTKKGKAGKIIVNYNGFTGISTVARKLPLLNAEQYATLTNESFVAAGLSPRFVDDRVFVGNTLVSGRNNAPNALGKGTDWQEEIFAPAFRKSHEVSVSGGSENSNFYLSFGMLDQDGIVTKNISNYNRKNIRLNANHNISKYLTIGENIGYSREISQRIGNANSETDGLVGYAINFDPSTPVTVEGTPAGGPGLPDYTQPFTVKDPNGNFYGQSANVGQGVVNPLAYAFTKLGNQNYADNIVGNVFAELQIVNGLKFKTALGAKLAYYGFDRFTPSSYLNSGTINLKNNYQSESNSTFGWNVENTLTYSKKIKNHNFTILLGQGAYVDNISRQVGIQKFGIATNDYQVASINFPVIDADAKTYGSTGIQHNISSLFSRLNYDYGQKYLLTAIVRRDGSSRFGDNFKFGVFPSFSLGWVVTKESFWKENNIVNYFKFRGGYGVVGNDNFGDLKYLSVVNPNNNYTIGTSGNPVIGNSPNAPSNPLLKWEETKQINYGIDAVFFKNLTVSLDFYNKKTVGILQQVFDLPGFIGATENPFANVSDFVNRGYDLELGYTKKIGKVNVSLKGNLSYLENEVTNLGFNKKFLVGNERVKASAEFTRSEIGRSVNEFYGFQTQGIFQNQAEVNAYTNATGGLIQPNAVPGDFRWKDIDGDGKITTDDRTFLGSPIPKYTFGFTINLDYENFDLLIFTQGVTGNKIYQAFRRLDIPNVNYTTEALGRWTGEGTSDTFPRLTRDDKNSNFINTSDFYIKDGDYLRIKTLQLGYSLPKSFLNKAHIQRTRIYVTGENLFTFTKYNGFDPEIDGNVFGIDKGFYPQAKSYMLGVNLQF